MEICTTSRRRRLEDVRNFFKTYYAPNNAVLTVVGDISPDAVKPIVEKYFTDIPTQSVPERPDVSEPPQTKEVRLTQADKLASVPALAFAYHLPDQEWPDYPAMVLLDLILQGDDSSRFYQRLVKEKAISVDWSGGINFELGNEFDYNGPMLLVSRTTYKPGHTGQEILKEGDAIVRDVQEHGVTKKELSDAKVRFRSNFYDQLESTFGKANLLASFALFRDDPSRINKILDIYGAVTLEQVQSAARKYLVPENRTAIDRLPEKNDVARRAFRCRRPDHPSPARAAPPHPLAGHHGEEARQRVDRGDGASCQRPEVHRPS